jgi:hypothetical protein
MPLQLEVNEQEQELSRISRRATIHKRKRRDSSAAEIQISDEDTRQ